jgi:hypothetical protein
MIKKLKKIDINNEMGIKPIYIITIKDFISGIIIAIVFLIVFYLIMFIIAWNNMTLF